MNSWSVCMWKESGEWGVGEKQACGSGIAEQKREAVSVDCITPQLQ
jgi:hypothetical protein